jgi:Ca-activated chloride channel homolog
MMPRLLSSLVLLLCALPVQALSPPPRPAPPPPPTVWIAPDSGNEPIRLESVDIRIEAQGFLARTRIELSFHNPNARVLEGEFVFPLGTGQTVSGYELEVEGRMRQGVVVPKQTARVAFEDISRQQIDPGLAELTAGNVFRTRLYPIPARGSKRVALSFEQVMPAWSGHYRYRLPLAFRESLTRFSLRAEASLPEGQGRVSSEQDLIAFDRQGPAWIAQLDRRDFTPPTQLAFDIPQSTAPALTLEAIDVLEPTWRTLVAQIDTGRAAAFGKAPKPRRIALFVDASGSAANRDLAHERAVLGRYLKRLDNVEVLLVPFRNAAEAPQSFHVAGGKAEALLKAIAELPLDGGSSYGAIDLSRVPGVDRVLVLGDGLSNFGEHEPRLGSGRVPPLTVLSASNQADHAALQRLALRGGGRVLDLHAQDEESSVALIEDDDWQLLSVEASAGRCAELLPAAPSRVGQRLRLSARCEAGTRLALRFGLPGQRGTLRELRVGEGGTLDGAMGEALQRIHAQSRIAALELEAEPDAEAIAALGTRYSVVTRHTSLLVLDRIEDYLRYRVEPKEEDLRAQYHARLPALPKPQAEDGMAGRIERLAALWRSFRDWHQTRHAWLETLLLPTAEAELRAWRALGGSGDAARAKRFAAGQREADALAGRSRELAARWQREGADPNSRQRWEREAGQLMLAIDRLRDERLLLVPPASANPAELGASPVLGRSEQAESMEGIEVSGSTISEGDLRDVPHQMAMPAPPPAPPAPALADSAPMGAMAPRIAAGAGPATRADDSMRNGMDAAPASARIQLRGWNPDTPYLTAIRAAADPYRAYLAERESQGDTPAFFLDCADYFRDEARRPELALRVLSNLAEIGHENTALVRVLAHRLAQWNEFVLAVGQFEAALHQRPEEPQSHRDLALALARLPQPDRARAVELLWAVASGEWHGRFPEIELIALHELNDLVAAEPTALAPVLQRLGVPAELVAPLPVGLRVSMSWDADNTDIDLWVVDPAGEAVYYSRNRSQSGGHVSRDFTQGYGPEVYSIARPLPGTYRIRAHYFGDRRQTLTGPVTVQIEFQTGFGSGKALREAVTVRLESGRDWIDLGTFKVDVAH